MNFDHAYFEQDRENISKKLDIGKEIIYLTKPECENIGLTRDDILEITKKTLISHGKKNLRCPQKLAFIHGQKSFSMQCQPMFQSKEPLGVSGSNATQTIQRSTIFHRQLAF